MERAMGIELHPKFLSFTEQGVTCRSGAIVAKRRSRLV